NELMIDFIINEDNKKICGIQLVELLEYRDTKRGLKYTETAAAEKRMLAYCKAITICIMPQFESEKYLAQEGNEPYVSDGVTFAWDVRGADTGSIKENIKIISIFASLQQYEENRLPQARPDKGLFFGSRYNP
ncbi:MAG: hypothetical protein ACRCUS_00380, partial [Anaerovoracaceae bacterium]